MYEKRRLEECGTLKFGVTGVMVAAGDTAASGIAGESMVDGGRATP
jgi:hypothetical protein